MNSFAKALVDFREARQMGRKELAAFLGKDPSLIYRWEAGTYPDPKNLIEVIGKLGGDFSRALPSYEPPQPQPSKDSLVFVPLIADVSAGWSSDVSIVHDADPAEFSRKVLSRSRFWKETDRKPYMLRVRGDSMSPTYPEGTLIIVAKPLEVTRIPAGTPVILSKVSDPNSFTFKLLAWGKDADGQGTHYGMAINPTYAPVAIHSREAKISAILIAAIHITEQVQDATHAPMFREPASPEAPAVRSFTTTVMTKEDLEGLTDH